MTRHNPAYVESHFAKCPHKSRLGRLAPHFRAIAFVLLGFVLGAFSRAQSPATPLPEILSINQIWTLQQDATQRSQPYQVSWEVEILFYSPEWRVLFAKQNGETGYLPTHGEPLKVSTGNKVKLTGSLIPDQGLDPEHLTIELLEENAFPDPIEITQSIEASQLAPLDFVRISAYASEGLILDDTHVRINLLRNDRWIDVVVRHQRDEPIPQVEGRFITVEGIMVGGNQNVEESDFTIWTEGIERISLDRELTTKRNEATSSLIDDVPNQDPETLVRVAGLVYEHDLGQQVTVRDSTGQMVVDTKLPKKLPSGTAVLVSGYPEKQGASWTLRDAVFEPASTQPFTEESELSDTLLFEYRLAEQVLSTPPTEIERGHSAHLSGVITFVDPNATYLYMHDRTGGLRIELTDTLSTNPQIGDAINISGTIAPGPFSPLVVAKEITLSGSLPLPQPTSVSYQEAISGGLDSQWVEISGYVETIEAEDRWTHLLLSTSQGNIDARILGSADGPAFTPGATVKLRGVLVTEANEKQEYRSVLFVVPHSNYAEVEIEAKKDPFNLPLTDIASLKRYEPWKQSKHNRRVRGSVAYFENGRTLFLSDGENVIRVLSHSKVDLEPDEVIEVVGRPQRSATGLYLRNAKIRKVGGVEPLESIPLEITDQGIDLELDGFVVNLSGTILSTAENGEKIRMFVAKGDYMIEASGASKIFSAVRDSLKPGAVLDLTGVYYLIYDEHAQVEEATLLLRRASDVKLVKGAPWWTPSRTLLAIILFSAFACAGGAWSLLLRKRVATQTEIIRKKIENEAFLESENREIARNSTDFIITLDFEGHFLSFNETGIRSTGYTKQEATNLTIYDLVDERTANRIRRVLKHRRLTKNIVFDLKIRNKSGDWIWHEASCGFIRRDGEAACAFAVLHDIDSRKQLESELTRAKVAAEENTQAKSNFLATMSHELRTPMNGIIGMTDLLLDLKLEEQAKQFGLTIKESAESLLVLLNDILDLSKAEAGKLTIDPHPFDLMEATRQTLTLLETSADKRGIELRCELPQSLSRNVNGDAGRLRQVLLNLVGNAIKFTPKGHVIVSSNIVSEDESSYLVRFEIEDTGIGISEKAKANLFQPFVQADNSHARRFGGTGLGLKISQEIVHLMGGEIGLESQEGVGSTFWFTTRVGKVSESFKNHVRKPKRKPRKWQGPKPRILVADDMPINQKVTSLQLLKMGLKADLAANGLEVIEAVSKNNYDIIFMDCQMPDMDGFEATRILRESPRNDSIYIIALTANAMAGDRERCIECGMNDYISKPTKPEKLFESLQNYANHIGQKS